MIRISYLCFCLFLGYSAITTSHATVVSLPSACPIRGKLLAMDTQTFRLPSPAQEETTDLSLSVHMTSFSSVVISLFENQREISPQKIISTPAHQERIFCYQLKQHHHYRFQLSNHQSTALPFTLCATFSKKSLSKKPPHSSQKPSKKSKHISIKKPTASKTYPSPRPHKKHRLSKPDFCQSLYPLKKKHRYRLTLRHIYSQSSAKKLQFSLEVLEKTGVPTPFRRKQNNQNQQNTFSIQTPGSSHSVSAIIKQKKYSARSHTYHVDIVLVNRGLYLFRCFSKNHHNTATLLDCQ